LFDFGNCGFFLAMGKETYLPKVNAGGAVESKKIIQLGITVDERCVDGLCFTHVVKSSKRYFADLSILEQPLREDEIEHPAS
jgi:pyruvate/2-oxoglutarate dehydrogenase complex dihydrolipoamide acyltransferase (E2) component